jgi:hypothetical protein
MIPSKQEACEIYAKPGNEVLFLSQENYSFKNNITRQRNDNTKGQYIQAALDYS